MTKVAVLGVDVGGVIIDRVNDNTDTSFFGDNYLSTTAVPGVFEALAELVQAQFEDRVYLVSKCGEKTEQRTLRWLEHTNFFKRTGIQHVNVRFCREHSGKALIAAKLGITHFVDDRLEILGSLHMVENLFLFNPRPEEIAQHSVHLGRVDRHENWDSAVPDILSRPSTWK